MPVSVLHVFGRMQRGGAEMRTLELMRHVDRERHRLQFCALSGLPGELDDEVRALGGKVNLVELGPAFPRRFGWLLRRERFDVVHSHVHHFSGPILWLAAQERIPVRIAHLRSTRDGHADGVLRNIQRRVKKGMVDRYATHILAVSEGVMSLAWNTDWRSDKRCRVVYNGIDTAPFQERLDKDAVRRELGLPAAGTLYIHVGNMREAKNHVRLVAIFREILRREPSSFLLLVGRGGSEIEESLREYALKERITDRIVFAGERRDVPRILKAADLMVYPSKWEGLPGAVLEACAAGTPVLASDLPGVREIAERLPGVRYLSLDEDDATWARAAEKTLAEFGSDAFRTGAALAFAGSVFNMETCVEAHCQVWRERRGVHGQ